jgi:hypothetical protein
MHMMSAILPFLHHVCETFGREEPLPHKFRLSKACTLVGIPENAGLDTILSTRDIDVL